MKSHMNLDRLFQLHNTKKKGGNKNELNIDICWHEYESISLQEPSLFHNEGFPMPTFQQVNSWKYHNMQREENQQCVEDGESTASYFIL
jgi:hypothetical protein